MDTEYCKFRSTVLIHQPTKHPDGRDYKHTREISQMVYRTRCPAAKNSTPSQLVHRIDSSDPHTRYINRRRVSYVTAEDLIFLIRHDRGEVNRLRTHLSWKGVWKHAKDSGGDGGGREVETLEHGTDDKLTTRAQKITWEIPTIYSEVLRQSGDRSDDEENEDGTEAYEASIRRLKEADDATR